MNSLTTTAPTMVSGIHNEGALLRMAHNNWATRPDEECYANLDELTDAARSQRVRSKDDGFNLQDLKVRGEGDSLIAYAKGFGDSETELSEWAFGQLCRFANVPVGFMKTLSPDTVSTVLNERLGGIDKDIVILNTEPEVGGVQLARAVVSETYSRIWNVDVCLVLKTLVMMAEQYGVKLYNPTSYKSTHNGLYMGDRDMFAMLVDGGDLSARNRGVRMDTSNFILGWNSEVGSKTYGFCGGTMNFVCGNHLIWGGKLSFAYQTRHRGDTDARMGKSVMALREFAEWNARNGDTIKRLTDAASRKALPKWDDEEDKFDFIVKHAQIDLDAAKNAVAYAEREEGGLRTHWDVAQGITAYGRDRRFMDDRTEYARAGGRYLQNVIDISDYTVSLAVA